MYEEINEDAPQWATDTANVIKALTPAAGAVRDVIRKRTGTTPPPPPMVTPSTTSGKGIKTQTLLIGAAAIVALYFIFNKKR